MEILTNPFKLTQGKNNSLKPFKIIVNNIQAAVLDLFNKKFKENKDQGISLYLIAKELSVPLEILKENLMPMLTKENNIIKKLKNSEGDNLSLSIEDSLILNDNFSFDNNNNPNLEEDIITLKFYQKNLKENFVQKEKFEGERSYAIEANIIKILKIHKRMNVHELMEKVMKSIEIFKINISDIKKRIDNLIDRSFIKRDKDNPQVYKYFEDDE